MAKRVLDRPAGDLLEEAAPASAHSPAAEKASPARFLNRELSWMAFNLRVLEEAENAAHPLLERLRFLSISDSNLDEFFMVRLAGFKRLALEKLPALSQDGLGSEQQVAVIRQRAEELIASQQECWSHLSALLREKGIIILDADDLDAADREWLRQQFRDRLLSVLTPIAIDPAHPFPFIPTRALVIIVELRRPDGSDINGLVLIPEKLERFLRLPGAAPHRYVTIEHALLAAGLGELFPGFSVGAHGVFRVLRDSDLEIEEEAHDLVEYRRTLFDHRVLRSARGARPADRRTRPAAPLGRQPRDSSFRR